MTNESGLNLIMLWKGLDLVDINLDKNTCDHPPKILCSASNTAYRKPEAPGVAAGRSQTIIADEEVVSVAAIDNRTRPVEADHARID